MLNPHLAIALAHERERELRQTRESVSAPRQLADHDDRPHRREHARLSRRWRVRASASPASASRACSESASAVE
jgi:hypothetical protein